VEGIVSIREWLNDFTDAPDDYLFLLPLWIATAAGLLVLSAIAIAILPFRLAYKLVKR
jgi:hypothetical protein